MARITETKKHIEYYTENIGIECDHCHKKYLFDNDNFDDVRFFFSTDDIENDNTAYCSIDCLCKAIKRKIELGGILPSRIIIDVDEFNVNPK